MKRREFMKLSAMGAAVAATPGLGRVAGAQATKETLTPMPKTQAHPLPDLGSHWELFEKLSERCVASKSFLNDEYTDPDAWVNESRNLLREHLHYQAPEVDFNPELIETVDRGEFTRELLMISITPESRIPVYVLVPKGLDTPAPALVALHDHGGFYFWGKEKIVGVDPIHPALKDFQQVNYEGRHIADELAKRGFVVIVSDMLHWGERGLYLDDDPERIAKRTMDVTAQDILDFNARSWAHEELMGRTSLTCGVTWAGINTQDDRRVADYLCTRPEVDSERVGCFGLSLGSVRSIFLGALHEKVRASVAVCWMAEYQPMARNNVRNGIGFTKLVPGLYQDLDWPDVGALHYPGALMTINGLQDILYPLEASQSGVEKLNAIYKKMGASEKYNGIFFDGPHEFNIAMQEKAFDWLEDQLK